MSLYPAAGVWRRGGVCGAGGQHVARRGAEAAAAAAVPVAAGGPAAAADGAPLPGAAGRHQTHQRLRAALLQIHRSAAHSATLLLFHHMHSLIQLFYNHDY